MTHPSAADAIRQALDARTGHRGEITLPCVPAALDHYVIRLQQLFELQGKPLWPHEVHSMRSLPLRRIDDQSVHDYERRHAPAELRWLLFGKKSG